MSNKSPKLFNMFLIFLWVIILSACAAKGPYFSEKMQPLEGKRQFIFIDRGCLHRAGLISLL